MKVRFSWWESSQSNCSYEWDVPYCDTWALRCLISDSLELLRLRRENAALREEARRVSSDWPSVDCRRCLAAKCDHARGPRSERGLCPRCNYPLTFVKRPGLRTGP